MFAYGDVLPDEIDHIDRDPSNNRLSNLRAATRSQNARNKKIGRANTSGATGVTWHKRIGKWQAQIEMERKSIYLGVYSDLSDAVSARAEAARRYFGEWRGETP